MATKEITDASFSADVLGSSTPVLIDFWAEWCGPCRQIAPALEELSNEYEGKIVIAKLNIDENPQTPGQFGVRGIPTMMIFSGGELVATSVGAKPKGAIAAWIDGALKEAVA